MTTKNCVVCGRLFDALRNTLTCSPACRLQRFEYRLRRRCPRKAKAAQIRYRERHREQSRARYREKRVLAVRNCVVCGGRFNPKGQQKTCSTDCREIRKLETGYAWRKENLERIGETKRRYYEARKPTRTLRCCVVCECDIAEETHPNAKTCADCRPAYKATAAKQWNAALQQRDPVRFKAKVCERSRRWRLKNRDRINAKARAFAAANREFIAARAKRFYDSNPEKYRAIALRSYHKHKETYLAKGREWRRQNPEAAHAADRLDRKKYGAAKKEAQRRFRFLNPEQARAIDKTKRDRNIEQYRRRDAEWAQKNPHKCLAKARRRRTSRAAAKAIVARLAAQEHGFR